MADTPDRCASSGVEPEEENRRDNLERRDSIYFKFRGRRIKVPEPGDACAKTGETFRITGAPMGKSI